jgi:prevent-host-death family protein
VYGERDLRSTANPTKFSCLLEWRAIRTVNIHAAKTHLSRLVEEAAAGEEIVIAKSGKPVARLCPLSEPRKRREFGRLRGQFEVPDDFDTMFEDEIRELFEKGC